MTVTIHANPFQILGKSVIPEAFSAVSKLGPAENKLVNSYLRAYKRLMFAELTPKRAAQARAIFKKYQEQLALLVERKTIGSQNKLCMQELMKRYVAVEFRSTGNVKLLAEALKESEEELAKELSRYLNSAEQIQGFASALVGLATGTEFTQAYNIFKQVITPENPALTRVFAEILRDSDGLRRALSRRKTNPHSYGGYLSRYQGMLFEAYIGLSKVWRKEINQLMREARIAARQLGPEWKAVRVTGGIKQFDKEFWDEAILLVRRSAKGEDEAILFMAAQFKAEKKLSALKQIVEDGLREADALHAYGIKNANVPNYLTVTNRVNDKLTIQNYKLIPNAGGRPPLRYVVNTNGAKLSKSDLTLLNKFGIQVKQLEDKISAKGMRSIADAFAQAGVKSIK